MGVLSMGLINVLNVPTLWSLDVARDVHWVVGKIGNAEFLPETASTGEGALIFYALYQLL